MEVINKIKNLFQKRMQEQLSDSEKKEFEGIILDKENEFAIKQTLFEQIRDFENYPEDENIDFDKQTHDFYLKIRSLKEEREQSKYFSLEFKQRKMFKRILRVAAIFVLLAGYSFIFYYYVRDKHNTLSGANDKQSQFVVTAPLGAKSNILLPDGTNVWLNAGSTLTYSSTFNSSNRELALNGEAYFEVAKNKNLPFEVVTSEISVIAIGTKFNVKAYPEEDIIETTLVEGRVKIIRNNHSKKGNNVFLSPNETATYVKKSSEIVAQGEETVLLKPEKMEIKRGAVLIQEKINSEIYTSWKDTQWQFEAEKLADLAKKLERKFRVKVVFEDQNLTDYKFSGTLEDETLEQVLEAIKLSAPIEFLIDNNTVTIVENKKHKKEYNRILK